MLVFPSDREWQDGLRIVRLIMFVCPFDRFVVRRTYYTAAVPIQFSPCSRTR